MIMGVNDHPIHIGFSGKLYDDEDRGKEEKKRQSDFEELLSGDFFQLVAVKCFKLFHNMPPVCLCPESL